MNQLTDGKSLDPAEHPPDETLYEMDFVLWANRQAQLLRHGRLDEIDRKHRGVR